MATLSRKIKLKHYDSKTKTDIEIAKINTTVRYQRLFDQSHLKGDYDQVTVTMPIFTWDSEIIDMDSILIHDDYGADDEFNYVTDGFDCDVDGSHLEELKKTIEYILAGSTQEQRDTRAAKTIPTVNQHPYDTKYYDLIKETLAMIKDEEKACALSDVIINYSYSIY